MERDKSREEWQKLCDARIADAETLLEGGRFDAAYYLAGYAVECALKARIVRLLEGYFPPKQSLWIHDLERLAVLAELKEEFEATSKANPLFADQWDTLKQWSENSRYDSQDPRVAEDMLKAVRGVTQWLREYL
jgi:HEPN domain-containing protein